MQSDLPKNINNDAEARVDQANSSQKAEVISDSDHKTTDLQEIHK